MSRLGVCPTTQPQHSLPQPTAVAEARWCLRCDLVPSLLVFSSSKRMRTVILLALSAALGSFPASAHANLLVGVADQNVDTFSKPLYRQLGLPITRLVVPLDAARDPGRRAWVADWLAAARAAGQTPLVSFGHFSGESMRPPSAAAYRRAFSAFMRAFPSVGTYTTWNEANNQAQPTFHHPQLVARYYRIMRSLCRRCRIVAADVLDNHSAPAWLRSFLGAVPGPKPRLWGLHNYSDANRHHRIAYSGTARVLATVPGQLWLTETGGVVQSAALRFDNQRAANAMRYLFTLARAWPGRIRRIYVYNWRGVVTARSARRHRKLWDSGLTDPNGQPRPSYFALRAELKRLRLGRWARPRHSGKAS